MWGLRVLSTDKDGGYALEQQHTLTKVTESIMGGRFYEEIPPNVDMRCYFNIAHEIIKEIAMYEKQLHLTRELLSQ